MPPCTDFRQHFLKRRGAEERMALPDPKDHRNWAEHLMVGIVGQGQPPAHLSWSLPLYKGIPYREDDADDVHGLMWIVEELQAGCVAEIGSCFLWSPGERICQLSPMPARRSSNLEVHTTEDRHPNWLREWTHHNVLSISSENRKAWGRGVRATLDVSIERYAQDAAEAEDSGDGRSSGSADGGRSRRFAWIKLKFNCLDADHVHDEWGRPALTDWPAMFRILPWV